MRTREALVGASLALALLAGSTACSASSPNPDITARTQANHDNKSHDSGCKAEVVNDSKESPAPIIYNKDCTREIDLSHTTINESGSTYWTGNIYQLCVNGIIYSQTEGGYEAGASTQIIDTAWARGACIDNRLTPADFR